MKAEKSQEKATVALLRVRIADARKMLMEGEFEMLAGCLTDAAREAHELVRMARRPKPLPLYPSPCCGLETAWVNDYRRACPCGKEHRF